MGKAGLVLLGLGRLLLGKGSLADGEVHSEVLGGGEAREPVVKLVHNPEEDLVHKEASTIADRVDSGLGVGLGRGRGGAGPQLGHLGGNVGGREHLDINLPVSCENATGLTESGTQQPGPWTRWS